MLTQTMLHRINNMLSLIVIGLAFYILILPFVPEAEYEIVRAIRPQPKETGQQVPVAASTLVAMEHRLMIPAIGVDAPILEGQSPEVLDKGIWHRPNTNTPDKGGNTVLVGHRFMYTSGPTTFYLLPKLVKDDRIYITWNGVRYEYAVMESHIVQPTAVEIEAPTSEVQLTLYTCTPVWNPTQRFVIKATPVL